MTGTGLVEIRRTPDIRGISILTEYSSTGGKKKSKSVEFTRRYSVTSRFWSILLFPYLMFLQLINRCVVPNTSFSHANTRSCVTCVYLGVS